MVPHLTCIKTSKLTPSTNPIHLTQEYQAIVDAEWTIIYTKLEAIAATGAKVVLSRLPIGDLATQYFADRDIFCAGRVAVDDLKRVVQAVGGAIQSTCSDIQPEHLGECATFEEKQIGGERFNLFEGCKKAKTCTLLLRGGAEQFIAEVERSLHDAIMIVKRAIKNNQVVAGGGATEVISFPIVFSQNCFLTDHFCAYPSSDGSLKIPPRLLSHHRRQATINDWCLRESARSNPATNLRQRRN